MKNSILALLFTTFLNICFAQSEHQKRISYGLHFAPGISSFYSFNDRNSLTSLSKSKFASEKGVELGIAISEKNSLLLGLGYNNFAHEIVFPFGSYSYNTAYSENFLEFSVQLKKKFLFLLFSPGLSAAYYLNTSVSQETIFEGNVVESKNIVNYESHNNKFFSNVMFSIGKDFQIVKNLSLFTGLKYKTSIIPVTGSFENGERYHFLGVIFSVNFSPSK